jgi:hypothetical protein
VCCVLARDHRWHARQAGGELVSDARRLRREGDYGFMPHEPCDQCAGRWPTRYQYIVQVDGPDGTVSVRLCQICFGEVFADGVRRFNLKYTGTGRHHEATP